MSLLDPTFSTYSFDRSLFRELGLRFFENIPVHTTVKVGTIRVHQASVEIYVYGAPAQFWHFHIRFDDPQEDNFIISTGSGSFSDYWKFIEKIASRMIVVQDANTKIIETDIQKGRYFDNTGECPQHIRNNLKRGDGTNADADAYAYDVDEDLEVMKVLDDKNKHQNIEVEDTQVRMPFGEYRALTIARRHKGHVSVEKKMKWLAGEMAELSMAIAQGDAEAIKEEIGDCAFILSHILSMYDEGRWGIVKAIVDASDKMESRHRNSK